MRRLRKLIRDTEGATAVEYGLIVALLVIVILVGVGNFANATTGMWNVVSNNVEKNT
jgi:pilus assembly protein Flp/PilA